MNESYPVIILGGSGYVAGEMLRLVSGHPALSVGASVSTSLAGEPIAATFRHLAPAVADQCFVSVEASMERLGEAEHWVLLSAAPHGASATLVSQFLQQADAVGTKLTVVDASADFRFSDPAAFEAVYSQPHPASELLTDFVCAVPEHLTEWKSAHAAHPGCFATSMLLGIVPLLAAGLCDEHIQVSAVTGSTGAGRAPRETTHHPERQSNLFAYQPLQHRHEPEVATLTKAATGKDLQLSFVPHSGPFARGIHATIFAKLTTSADAAEVNAVLEHYYRDSPFVQLSAAPPRMKDVAGSNFATLSAHQRGETIVVFSVLDNLLKGAAGGSIQWVNRLLGLPETTGLMAPAAGWI